MNVFPRESDADVSSLNISDQIVLSSLIASMPAKQQIFSIDQSWIDEWTPSIYLSKCLIEQLIVVGAISVSEPEVFSPSTFKLKIENNDSNLACLIKNIQSSSPTPSTHLKGLTLDLLAAECANFTLQLFGHRNIEVELDFQPPRELYKLLGRFSCSEIHMLLWMSYKSLTNSELRIFNACYGPIDLVRRIALLAEQKSLEYEGKRNIKPFGKPRNFKHSALNSILFSQHLKVDYFNKSWSSLDSHIRD